ncbi:SH3 domain-containing protein [Trichococcus pasteurii]|uniref:Peptidase m15b/m15c n=1 Tax=Trichococcus pasteurii TaxID=43064 RepID=A0A1W1IDS1_9LACT|nr:SH3 domain-containing protein [Trichococcus pasteurii]SFE06020.1 D-alanyl-D-alanine carboxypeptidase [Trichococcus pasteurii]SLM51160.1 peptidase m15b/m15c [Trichococcus pasteurii]SSB92041.1 peptidase m15b/m15c [Trichococcus pasteurii]
MSIKRNWRRAVIGFLTAVVLSACSGSDEQTETEESKSASANSAVKEAASSETSKEEDTAVVQPEEPEPLVYEGSLELPVNGATGYASVRMDLKAAADAGSETISALEAGTAFEVVEEVGDWWYVQTETESGWVQHLYCFINLPDVIPSIIYDNTNTYASKFVSSGKAIPGITGVALYDGKAYNMRLGKVSDIVPVLYSMSKKIYLAQQAALAEGNTLVIYEGYRPYSAQKMTVDALTNLAASDPEVMAGINTHPWDTNWFIATSVSNHQMGYAIDVTLAKITEQQEIVIGDYAATAITGYTEYTMPTTIHELSMASATFTGPVKSSSPTAWLQATLADTMNEAAILLQRYCTDAGLTPLASEWWHFNDLDARFSTEGNSSKGEYLLDATMSEAPEAAI